VIRVLHIDDEAPIRLLVRVNLEAEGMEVIEAANGRSGVQMAKRERPDLILLGVMMPVLDGWEAAEELRTDQETREIPIVFLTARSKLIDQARGLDLGALDYILKPFNPMELAPRVRGLLERLERGDAHWAGDADARQQTDFEVFATDPSMLVLRHYGDNVIAARLVRLV
jgi:DNA-binding response OmpR family regulator